MKQLMIDMMAAIMPFMRPFAVVIFIVAVAGFAIALVNRGALGGSLLRWSGILVLAAGVFFIACELAGRFLGFAPTLLFADPLDRQMYLNQWPFWTIGILYLVAGFLLRRLAPATTR